MVGLCAVILVQAIANVFRVCHPEPLGYAQGKLRPQPNARSVGQPEPAALGLLNGELSAPHVARYPRPLSSLPGNLEPDRLREAVSDLTSGRLRSTWQRVDRNVVD